LSSIKPNDMDSIQQTYSESYKETATKKSAWKRFIAWAAGQEENKFLWLAVAIFGHGCFLTIITVLVILFTGNHFIFWPFAIGAMAMTLISNLAAMPTRITIPIFFLSILIDLLIIIITLTNGVDISGTYV